MCAMIQHNNNTMIAIVGTETCLTEGFGGGASFLETLDTVGGYFWSSTIDTGCRLSSRRRLIRIYQEAKKRKEKKDDQCDIYRRRRRRKRQRFERSPDHHPFGVERIVVLSVLSITDHPRCSPCSDRWPTVQSSGNLDVHTSLVVQQKRWRAHTTPPKRCQTGIFCDDKTV